MIISRSAFVFLAAFGQHYMKKKKKVGEHDFIPRFFWKQFLNIRMIKS